MRVPNVTAVMAKTPTGTTAISSPVILESAASRFRSSSMNGRFRASPINAHPSRTQKRTMAGISPSARDVKMLEGRKSEIRSVSSPPETPDVLKNEVGWTGGKAYCMAKKTSTPRPQITRTTPATFRRSRPRRSR